MPLPAALVALLPTLIGKVLEKGGEVIDKVIPDKAAAEKAKQALAEKTQDQDFQLSMQNLLINLADAQSGKWYQAGWRPAIGWVCVAIVGLSYIPKALVLTAFWAYQCYLVFNSPGAVIPAMPPFPDLGLTDVMGILGTLLGSAYLAKLRTDEKKEGVTR